MLLVLLQEAAKKAEDVPEASTSALTMNPLLWIGFGFTAAIVLFFMVTIYLPPKANPLTRKTMHFLTALCGAMAGGFITGGAILHQNWGTGAAKGGLSATGGFVLGLLTWYAYGKIPEDGAVDFPPTIGIGPDWTLEMAANTMAQAMQCAVDFGGLSAKERNAPLNQQQLRAQTWEKLMETLRNITKGVRVRDYTVKLEGSVFHFKVKG